MIWNLAFELDFEEKYPDRSEFSWNLCEIIMNDLIFVFEMDFEEKIKNCTGLTLLPLESGWVIYGPENGYIFL